MTDSLLILGAGGHGRSIYELASLSGAFSHIAYLDDSWKPGGEKRSNIIGCIDQLKEYAPRYTHAVIGIGNNNVREQLQCQALNLGLKLATLIHPKAIVSPSVKVGSGTVIFAGVVIGVDAHIGQGVIINCTSTVDHDGMLEDFSHLGVGVHLAGSAHIGKNAFVQVGSCGGYKAYVEAFSVCAPGTVLKTRA
ncbi:sugar O-acyltransferase [Ewingella sp. S1.OA.A_B6]